MGAPRDFSLSFGGAGIQEIRAVGRFIRILEAPTSNIWVEVDAGSELKRVAGQDVDNGAPFSRFRIRSAVAQTILLTVSDTRQADDQESVSVSVSATVAPGNTLPTGGDVSIPALSSATVLAADATRLAGIVHNLSDQALRIGGAGVGAATGVPLDPGEKIAIASTAIIAAYNPHATVAKSVAVLPIREV